MRGHELSAKRWISSQAVDQRLSLEQNPAMEHQAMRPTTQNLCCRFTHVGLTVGCGPVRVRLGFKRALLLATGIYIAG